MDRWSWSGVPGTFGLEIFYHNQEVVDTEERKLPVLLRYAAQLETCKMSAELTLEFTSRGYYDPGNKLGGDPSRWYPAEGNDQREVVYGYLTLDGGFKVVLPKDVLSELEGIYLEEIEGVRLE